MPRHRRGATALRGCRSRLASGRSAPLAGSALMARAAAPADGEAPPEADRLEGFAHPRETARLYGHEQAERALAQAFAAGHMHHAWLLTGRLGIGKATLAYRLARYALARPQERDPAAFEVPPQTRGGRQGMGST